MAGLRWTLQEDRALSFRWGAEDIVQIGTTLGRSPAACEKRARALGLRWDREGLSLREAARRTGYDRRTIQLAARELGMKVHTAPRVSLGKSSKRKHVWHLQEEALERIVQWLTSQPTWRACRTSGGKTRQGEWGVGIKPAACEQCGATERPHYALGLCKRCWDRKRYLMAPRGHASGTAPHDPLVDPLGAVTGGDSDATRR